MPLTPEEEIELASLEKENEDALNSSGPGKKSGKIMSTVDYLAGKGRSFNESVQRKSGDIAEKYGLPGAVAGTALGTASEVLVPQDRLGVLLSAAGVAAKPLAAGVKAGAKLATPGTKKVMEGLYKILPNVYPSTSKYLLKNWDEVLSAPSIEKAREIYAKAAGGLKHWTESVSERFGTIAPSEKIEKIVREAKNWLERSKKAADQIPISDEVELPYRLAKSGKEVAMTPQKALDSIQAINLKQRSVAAEIKDSTLRAQKTSEFAEMKDKLYDYLENNGAPALRAAGKTLRNAFVKDEITSFLPTNKGGDKNVLRGIGAGYQLLEGLRMMPEKPMVGALKAGSGLMFSPKVFTGVANQSKKLIDALSRGRGVAKSAGAIQGIRAALRGQSGDR